jgi:mono/diheme cytochrome c family protein
MRGMPAWDDLLTEAEVAQIHAWLVAQANAAWSAAQSAAPAARQGVSEGHL